MLQLLVLVAACANPSPTSSARAPQEGGDAPAPPPGGLELEWLASPVGPLSALPNLAQGADGRVYLSWVDREGGDTGVLRFCSLTESGWGEPLEIHRGEDLFLNWADFPSVCALESGLLIAHWLREGEVPHGYTAEFSLSADQGRSWTPPKTLHSDLSPVEHGFVSIVPVDRETFGAVWLDGRRALGQGHGAGETGLYFRTISTSGELGPETVLDARVCDCCQTGLGAGSAGELLAIYRDRSLEEVRDISLARFAGGAWSEPESVHDDGWEIAGCPVNGPRIVSARGTTAAAWFTGVGEGGGSVLVAFQAAGASAFASPLDADDGLPVGRVDLVVAPGGSVLVSWLEFAGEAGAEWRVRRLWPDGRAGDSVVVAGVSSERASGFLRMVSCADDVVLTWTATDGEKHVETARLKVR